MEKNKNIMEKYLEDIKKDLKYIKIATVQLERTATTLSPQGNK